jgi:hypothetical protein
VFAGIVCLLGIALIRLTLMLRGFRFLFWIRRGLSACLGLGMIECLGGILNMEILIGYLLGLKFVFYGNLLLLGCRLGNLQIEIRDDIRYIYLLFLLLFCLFRFHINHFSFLRLILVVFILLLKLEKIEDCFCFVFSSFLINLKNFISGLLITGIALNFEDREACL